MVVLGSKNSHQQQQLIFNYFFFFLHRDRKLSREKWVTTQREQWTEFGQFGQSLNTSLSHKVRVRTDHIRSGDRRDQAWSIRHFGLTCYKLELFEIVNFRYFTFFVYSNVFLVL